MEDQKNYETIHFHMYDPSGPSLFKSEKNARASSHLIKCRNKDNCNLYSKGECICRGLFNGGCKYGYRSEVEGYTRRAKKFHEWIREQKEIYKEVESLKQHQDKIVEIGDYVYLPYSHINMNKGVKFDKHSEPFISGNYFLPKEEFTPENISKMIEFRPRAFFGGEITDYQNKSVPKFLTHLKEYSKDLYEKSIALVSDKEKYEEAITNIGRKAKLFTLKPCIGEYKDIHKGTWVFDGEYLVSKNSKASFMLVDKFDEIRIKPREDAIVKVTDEEQVLSSTEFID